MSYGKKDEDADFGVKVDRTQVFQDGRCSKQLAHRHTHAHTQIVSPRHSRLHLLHRLLTTQLLLQLGSSTAPRSNRENVESC